MNVLAKLSSLVAIGAPPPGPYMYRPGPNVLSRKPELYELDYLENISGRRSVQIIECIQGDWERLVGHLRIPGHNIRAIRGMQPFTPEIACREVFRLWLNGGEDEFLSPKNWDMLIKVMHRIGNSALGDKIKDILLE